MRYRVIYKNNESYFFRGQRNIVEVLPKDIDMSTLMKILDNIKENETRIMIQGREQLEYFYRGATIDNPVMRQVEQLSDASIMESLCTIGKV